MITSPFSNVGCVTCVGPLDARGLQRGRLLTLGHVVRNEANANGSVDSLTAQKKKEIYTPRTLWGSSKLFLQIIASTKYQINSQNDCSILRWRIRGRMDLDGTGMGGRKRENTVPPLASSHGDSFATVDVNAPFVGRIAVTDQGGHGHSRFY